MRAVFSRCHCCRQREGVCVCAGEMKQVSFVAASSAERKKKSTPPHQQEGGKETHKGDSHSTANPRNNLPYFCLAFIVSLSFFLLGAPTPALFLEKARASLGFRFSGDFPTPKNQPLPHKHLDWSIFFNTTNGCAGTGTAKTSRRDTKTARKGS